MRAPPPPPPNPPPPRPPPPKPPRPSDRSPLTAIRPMAIATRTNLRVVIAPPPFAMRVQFLQAPLRPGREPLLRLQGLHRPQASRVHPPRASSSPARSPARDYLRFLCRWF